MRTSLASMFIFIGFVLSFFAVLALWEQRYIANEDNFVNLGKDVLGKPPVQQAIADSMSLEVRDLVRRNTSNPPSNDVIDGITLAAIQNLSQSGVADDSLRKTHQLLERIADLQDEGRSPVQADEDNGTLVLDLRTVVQNVLGNTQLLDPSLRGRVDVPPDTGRIVIVRNTEIEVAIKLLRAMDRGAKVLMLLPFLAFGIALVVAPSRSLTLMVIGGAVAGGAALRLFILEGPLASLMRDLLAETPTAQGAGLATYDSFVDSFAHQDTLVLIAGGVVAGLGLVMAVLLYRRY